MQERQSMQGRGVLLATGTPLVSTSHSPSLPCRVRRSLEAAGLTCELCSARSRRSLNSAAQGRLIPDNGVMTALAPVRTETLDINKEPFAVFGI